MIVELTSSSDRRVPGLLELAHRLFEPETLEPDELLIAEIDGVRPGNVRYFVWDEGGVRGFCRAAFISAGTLIVHLGVDESFQNSGIGTRLLGHVRRESDATPVYAEVEGGTPMEWWQNRGARPVWDEYVQPPLRPDTGAVPLTLMAIGERIDAVQAIRSIYEEFYGRWDDDSLLMQVIGEARE